MAGEPLQLLADGAISLDALAGRRGDLQQLHPAAIGGPAFQQRLDAADALRQALCVVEPVDADDERLVVGVAGKQLQFRRARIALRVGRESLRIDADRESVDGERPAETLQPPVVQPPHAEVLDGVAGEVLAVAHGLEADEVVGEEGAGELLVVRQRRDDLGRREGDVEEEADGVGRLPLAQIGGEAG